MTFRDLALIVLAGLAGPLLASSRRIAVPLVVGEIVAGIAFGPSGLGVLDADTPFARFLAQAGFALLMLVVGMKLPLRMPGLAAAARTGVFAALLGFALAVPVALGVSAATGLASAGPLIIVIAACSASTALPMLRDAGLPDHAMLAATAWIVAADASAIIAMPVVFHPSRLVQVVIGAASVTALSALSLVATRTVQTRQFVLRLRASSHERGWALDLRMSLLGLFVMAYVAQRFSLSVLVAGFSAGVILAVLGDSKRLFMQLLGIGEGFFIPFFFVTLGARLHVRALFTEPRFLVLTGAILASVIAVRLTTARVLHLQPAVGLVATAQLGVPAAVVSIGLADGTLPAGAGAAIIVAALLTLAVSAFGTRRLASVLCAGVVRPLPLPADASRTDREIEAA
jgi:Kef-type K+ transport system membrane component KefB